MQIATFSTRRLMTWLALAMVCCFGALGVWAQTASQPLVTGEASTGTLDAQNAAQVYTFTAAAGDRVNVVAQSTAPLALLLTDTTGAVLGQVVGEQGASLLNITASEGGTYFVTVFAAPGSAAAAGDFSVMLAIGDVPPELLGTEIVTQATAEVPLATESPVVGTVDATLEPVVTVDPTTTTGVSNPVEFVPPTDILISGQMEVRLTWDADVDMNLNVRDPLGNQLFWNSATSPIGGRFGFDANGLCEVISDVPVETATWTPGFLPTGSYEVLVFYRQSCVTPAQPVAFTLQITVNGVALPPVTGTLTPPPDANQNSVYVTSFKLDADATARLGAGGVYPDSSLRVLPAAANEVLSEAQPITRDTPLIGAIVGGQFYQAYSFDALANEIVSISLARTEGIGSLDTLLQVVDANGNLVDVNDDVDLTTTNSALTNLRLLRDGRYTIIATRYGKDLGGSEGEFDLLLTGPSGELPAEVATLGLPEGAIQVSLTWNTGADIQLLVRDPVGDSVFDDKPQINSGGILAANGNVNCVRSTNPTPVSYIYWPNGFLRPGTYEIDVWYQNQCNDTTPVEFSLTTLINGEILISDRQRPAIAQHYVVSFTVNNDGTATRREGGFITDATPSFDFSTAPVTTLNLNQPVTGQITPDDNFFQVYGFNGTAGQQITINMSSTTPALDTKLFLISPTGAVAEQNDDAQPGTVKNSLINDATLQETGQYLIIATRYAMQFGGTVGGYTLVVTP